jgi:hypothetical protein
MAGNYKESPSIHYITTEPFHRDLYSYTLTSNLNTFYIGDTKIVDYKTFTTVGTLSSLSNATAINCPAGRILRETGKKLNAGVNPGISTMLVSIFDEISAFTGFIDPNSPKFAIYNSHKSVYLPDSIDPRTGLSNLGPPIYTRGDVIAGGYGVFGSNVTIQNGDLNLSTGTVNLASAALVFPSAAVGVATMPGAAGNVHPNTVLTVFTSACKVTSKVFLTFASQTSPVGFLSAENITNGSFQIVVGTVNCLNTVQWMVIN